MTDVERNAILGNVQRQYVGARYVPKFFQGPDGTPTWVGNVPYEALTIVTYLGNSYTSKVPVPAGIGNPSQNPTYWALTGNFNSQVEGIYQDLSTKEKNFKNKKLVLIGDSYATPSTGNIFSPFLTSGYFTPENIRIEAEGGCGFIRLNGNNRNYLSLLNRAFNNEQNPEAVDIVVVAGGYNDVTYNRADIINAANEFITVAKNHFKNAKVYGYFCANNYNNYDYRRLLDVNVIPAWEEAFTKNAFFIDSGINVMHSKDNFTSDFFHPSPSAGIKLGNILISTLISGVGGAYRACFNAFNNPIDGVTISHRLEIKTEQRLTLIKSLATHSVTLSSPINPSLNKTIPIANIPDNVLIGNPVYLPCYVNTLNTTIFSFLSFIDGKINILIQGYNDTGTQETSHLFILPLSTSVPWFFL